MQLVMMEEAYQRFTELQPGVARKEAETNGELCFTEWRGIPAVYAHDAYWMYELDRGRKIVALTACLGVLLRPAPLRSCR